MSAPNALQILHAMHEDDRALHDVQMRMLSAIAQRTREYLVADRVAEMRAAEEDLHAAHDRAEWARWRLMLATGRLELAVRRAAMLEDRVRPPREP